MDYLGKHGLYLLFVLKRGGCMVYGRFENGLMGLFMPSPQACFTSLYNMESNGSPLNNLLFQ